MNKKLLDDYVVTEITREARIRLKHLWILENPEINMRKFLSNLILNYVQHK